MKIVSSSCWLSHDNAFIWAFGIPFMLLILVGFVRRDLNRMKIKNTFLGKSWFLSHVNLCDMFEFQCDRVQEEIEVNLMQK